VRKYWTLLAIVCLLLPFVWREVAKSCLKMFAHAKWGWELSFRELRYEHRGFQFDGVAVSKPDAFQLHSEQIRVHIQGIFPLQLSLMIDHPNVTLSKAALQGERSTVVCALETTKGRLDWSDGTLPAADLLVCKGGSAHLGKVALEWAEGTLSVEAFEEGERTLVHAEANRLPLERLVKIAKEAGWDWGDGAALGTVTGTVHCGWVNHRLEDLSVEMEGKELHMNWGPMQAGGTLSVDWKMGVGAEKMDWKSLIQATKRLRLSIEEGEMEVGPSSLKHLQGGATYLEGIGPKWELSATGQVDATEIPFHSEGKGFENRWLEGNVHLGTTMGLLDGSKFTWNGLGPTEFFFLQNFAALAFPLCREWKWSSGTLAGEMEALELARLTGEGISIESLNWEFKAGCQTFFYDRSEGKVDGLWAQGTAPFPIHATGWQGEWLPGRLTLHGRVEEQEGKIECAKGEIGWLLTAGIEGLFKAQGVVIDREEQFDLTELKGDVRGLSFEGTGQLRMGESWIFAAQIPQFEGLLTPWHLQYFPSAPLESGIISSIDSGIECAGIWNRGLEELDWSLHLKMREGKNQLAEEVEFELSADPDRWDFAFVQGVSKFHIGSRAIEIPFEAPRIRYSEESLLFDVRLKRKTWDILRLAGEKVGNEVFFDSDDCSILGAPLKVSQCLWDETGLVQGSLDTAIYWPLLCSLMEEIGLPVRFTEEMAQLGALKIEGEFFREGGSLFRVSHLAGFPFKLQVLENKGLWEVDSLLFGPLAASCHLEYEDKALRLKGGQATWGEGISFGFEGKFASLVQADFVIPKFTADFSRIGDSFAWAGIPKSGLVGTVSGQGCVAIGEGTIEADLDLIPKDVRSQDTFFTNEGPLHLYFSTEKGALFKGIDCKLTKENLEFRGKAHLLQIDRAREHWIVQKAHIQLPADLLKQSKKEPLLRLARLFDSGHVVELIAEIDCAFDFSECSIGMKEGFLPFGGAVRHLKDFQLFYNQGRCIGNTLFFHQGKLAKLSADVETEPTLQGRFFLEDLEREADTALSLDWSYDEGGINVQAIEGSFAGVDAAFHSIGIGTASHLIGTARVDFARFSDWVPDDISELFYDLKMGVGYEFKGHLSIDRKNISQIHFKGIFSGKALELFGYQFRTLLGQVELGPDAVHISDLKISDSAGRLKIEKLYAGSPEEGQPWIIEIPKLTIEDLRPSLLRKPGEEPGPLTPLLVRQLTLTDFKGLVEDGRTYTAQGELNFVNSFKREPSVFDLPSNVFGRIIGLDLELLIPVIGELSFKLEDGFFQLMELRKAYSENNRSEFFLVHSDSSPRMDLDGNLQILVKMKHFVLFRLTDAFLISIEGKLDDPQFRLQKKRRFLSIGS